MFFKSKEQMVQKLREDLSTKDSRALHALEVLYMYQAASEQISGSVDFHNGVGFTSYDSQILTSMYDFYRRNGFLSLKQINFLKKITPKYANQLVDHAMRNGFITKVKGGYNW